MKKLQDTADMLGSAKDRLDKIRKDINDQPLLDWEMATNRLCDQFIHHYFDRKATSIEWVGGEIGGIFEIADHWLDLNDVVTAMRERPEPDDLIEFYNYRRDLPEKESPVTLKYWLSNRK